MDFFEYASITGMFTNTLWIQFVVGAVCFAVVFVFEAIALFTIAKREWYKNKWMAFIPFLNTYYIGVCSQKNKFYNFSTKIISLIAAIMEVVLCAGYALYYAAFAQIESHILYTEQASGVFTQLIPDYSAVPLEFNWAVWIVKYFNVYVLQILELFYVVLSVFVLVCFFRTYAPRHYMLFSITSVLLPVLGILAFIVCRNKGTNYFEFLKKEQARQYRQYQQYQQQSFNQNPYNKNPYSGQSFYGSSYNQPQQSNGGQDPFEEFANGSSGAAGGENASAGGAGSGADPFDDFNA